MKKVTVLLAWVFLLGCEAESPPTQKLADCVVGVWQNGEVPCGNVCRGELCSEQDCSLAIALVFQSGSKHATGTFSSSASKRLVQAPGAVEFGDWEVVGDTLVYRRIVGTTPREWRVEKPQCDENLLRKGTFYWTKVAPAMATAISKSLQTKKAESY